MKGPGACPLMKCSTECSPVHDSVHSWTIDSAAEHQDSPGFGSNHEVLLVDRALNSSRLIWPLKVPFDRRAFLLEFEILRRGASVWIIAVQCPLPGDICGRHCGWRLLGPSGQLAENCQKAQGENTKASIFHHRVDFTFLTDSKENGSPAAIRVRTVVALIGNWA